MCFDRSNRRSALIQAFNLVYFPSSFHHVYYFLREKKSLERKNKSVAQRDEARSMHVKCVCVCVCVSQ